MEKKRNFFLILVLLFSCITVLDYNDYAHGHSMFNSAEKFEAGYRVQVATTPEFPQINEPSEFRIRVTEGYDYEEVDGFTMGIRILFNDKQVDAIPPTSIVGSHWDFDYVWKSQGNHIVLVDLYDTDEDQKVLTYIFNMGTQNPFGYIFFAAITVGALCLTVVVAYIYLPKIFKS